MRFHPHHHSIGIIRTCTYASLVIQVSTTPITLSNP
uniref:Uncharacterized protein n=1 Tax=Arundo donax TaxID=35708 RepID=A0A0A9CEA8_ARUDO